MQPWRAMDTQMEVLMLKTEAQRVSRPVVADSHHLDEEQDQDPDSHWNEKLDPDRHLSEKLDPDPH